MRTQSIIWTEKQKARAKPIAKTITARVSRTRSSSRCSASGIFGSSIGAKTFCWSPLKMRFNRRLTISFSLPFVRWRPGRRRSSWRPLGRVGGTGGRVLRKFDLPLPLLTKEGLLRIDHNEDRITLPTHKENCVFLFLDFSGGGFIILDAIHRLAVDFLDHIPALQTRLFRRTSPLHMGNDHTGRLRPHV